MLRQEQKNQQLRKEIDEVRGLWNHSAILEEENVTLRKKINDMEIAPDAIRAQRDSLRRQLQQAEGKLARLKTEMMRGDL